MTLEIQTSEMQLDYSDLIFKMLKSMDNHCVSSFSILRLFSELVEDRTCIFLPKLYNDILKEL